MDGGSRDNSVEIIQKYADLINRGEYAIRCKRVGIIWKSEKDRGQSDAINQGFSQATGDFFAYLNSDDVYLPGKPFPRPPRPFIKIPMPTLSMATGR